MMTRKEQAINRFLNLYAAKQASVQDAMRANPEATGAVGGGVLGALVGAALARKGYRLTGAAVGGGIGAGAGAGVGYAYNNKRQKDAAGIRKDRNSHKMHELKREANVNRAAAGKPAYERGRFMNALQKVGEKMYDNSPLYRGIGRFAGVDAE